MGAGELSGGVDVFRGKSRARVPQVDEHAVATAMETLEREGRVTFPAVRRHRVGWVLLLGSGAIVALLLSLGVVSSSGGIQTGVREPGLWLCTVAGLLLTVGCFVMAGKLRARERLVVTTTGFFTEIRCQGTRTREITVLWDDVAEIWTRWFGAFWLTPGSLLACYSLTPEAELRTRHVVSPRREAMRRIDFDSGTEVHALPQYFGARQVDVVEVMRRAHAVFAQPAQALSAQS